MQFKLTSIELFDINQFCQTNHLRNLKFLTKNKLGYFLYTVLYYFPLPFVLGLIDMWLDSIILISFGYKQTSTLESIEFIALTDNSGMTIINPFEKKKFFLFDETTSIHFYCFTWFQKYFVYDDSTQQFVPSNQLFLQQNTGKFLNRFQLGRKIEHLPLAFETFGKNEMIIDPPSIKKIITDQFFSIMGMLNLLTIVFLYIDDDQIQFLFTFFLIFLNLYNKITSQFACFYSILQHVSKNESQIVIRKNEKNDFIKLSILSKDVAPGDLIEITAGMTLSSDVLIIRGKCLINEGEMSEKAHEENKCAPDLKEIEHLRLDQLDDRNIIRSGASCISLYCSVNETILGIVINTSYNTKRGTLIRDFLMPKDFERKTFDEAVSLVFLLCFLYMIGACMFLIHVVEYKGVIKINAFYVMSWLFYMFIGIVKPCLPYCIMMGIQSSRSRLEAKGIETSNEYMINQCGKIKTIFLDKNGILSKPAADIFQFQPAEVLNTTFTEDDNFSGDSSIDDNFVCELKEESSIKSFINLFKKRSIALNKNDGEMRQYRLSFKLDSTKFFSETQDILNNHFYYCLAYSFCNSLVVKAGRIIGNEEELKLSEHSPFELNIPIDFDSQNHKKTYTLKKDFQENTNISKSFELIKEFEPNIENQAFSVLIRDQKNQYYLFSKCHADKITKICSNRTLPFNFNELVFSITTKGFNVSAYSMRKIQKSEISQSKIELEKKMIYLGLLSSQNKLQKNVKKVVEQLSKCQIQQIILTEENLFSSIWVAKKSGIIPSDLNLYFCLMQESEVDHSKAFFWINYEKLNLIKNRKLSKTLDMTNYDPDSFPEIEKNLENLVKLSDRICLAMTADVYKKLIAFYLKENSPFSEIAINYIHQRCLVFGDADPEQKKLILENYSSIKKQDEQIMFVGNRTADAKAIFTADVSLLLKKSHLSFKATFTSNNQNFESILDLVKEGKCSIESGYLTFRFFIFMTALQFVRYYFFADDFIGYNSYQCILMDFVISLYIVGYINVFEPNPRLSSTIPLSSLYDYRFMINLLLHSFIGIYVMIVAFLELKSLSFYKNPATLIPYEDKIDTNLNLTGHKTFEGTLFFFLECLLLGFFFIFTNYRSDNRVPLYQQKNAFFYLIAYIFLFAFMATLSSKNDPENFEKIFIRYLNIIKTQGTNEIYIKAILKYCLMAISGEMLLKIYYSYRDQIEFVENRSRFIQCREYEASLN